MAEIKIYIEISEEMEERFSREGRSFEKFLSAEAQFQTSREELIIKGENASRGLITFIAGFSGIVLGWIATEYMKESVKPIIKDFSEPTTVRLRKILKPLYDYFKIENPENNTKVYKIKENENQEKELIPVELPKEDETLELKEDILIRIENKD